MKSGKKYKRIVFCDFDNTITADESFVGMIKTFATIEYHEVKQLIIDRKITLGEGILRMVESIPSHKYSEVLDYSLSHRIRDGFGELLDYLNAQNVPLVVISGGLEGSVSTRLDAYRKNIHAIHAAQVSTANRFLAVSSAFQSDTQLVDKTRAMALYDYDESVIIGDGLTDIDMGLAADLVFARDYLAHYLAERKIPHIGWKNFFDIRDHLAKNRL